MSEPVYPLPPSTAPRRPGFFARRRADREAKALAAFHARTNERALAEQIAIVNAGYHLGPIPYGYKRLYIPLAAADGTVRQRVHLVVDPLAAEDIVTIFRLRIDEQLNPKQIADRLADIARAETTIGAPLPGHPDGPRLWTPRSVSRVLANPVYTGASCWGRVQHGQRMRPDDWVICPFAHQPLIDGRTFFRAQLLAPPAQRVMGDKLPAWEWTQIPHGDGPLGAAP